MLPRYRSFYGKLAFLIIVLVFIIYVIVPPNNTNNDNENIGKFYNVNSNDLDGSVADEAALTVADPTRTASILLLKQHLQRNNIERLIHNNNNNNNNNNTSITDINNNIVDPNVLIYELSIQRDLQKQIPGLGDNGSAGHLTGNAKIRGQKIYKQIALNEELSEQISYNRTLADYRHPACIKQQQQQHDDNLPTASVIIIFFNEPYSVLVRTVHSVLNTCTSHLLKEIILVDDASTHKELSGKLDYYIRTRLPFHKVHVIRLKNRLGLIRARLAGARSATGKVLIFLDAHCEANIFWCEPLLQRIKESRTSVLVPIIDVIDAETFKYCTNGYNSFQVGGFQWSGHFDWITVPERERIRQRRDCKEKDLDICPTHTPTMAGGLFAIDRSYFWEIGSYDEQMDGWGGENLEMSFRIWQCGGTIETIPCSRVGHVFRDFHPYSFPNNRDTHGINTARLALVWMDEYVNIFFMNRPDLRYHPDIGDITHRVMLRKKLRCKSFDWYLNTIYPEKFIPVKNVKYYGRVQALYTPYCLDDLQQNNEQPYNLGLYNCLPDVSKAQLFSLTNNMILRNELSCATVQYSKQPPHNVVMTTCLDNDDLNEKWQFTHNRLRHMSSGLCLDYQGLRPSDYVHVATCDPHSRTQSWNWSMKELK